MDQCTHEVRLQYWKNIISLCHERPSGQTAKQWLKENGICEQTYYSWQRKIRQESYTSMQDTSKEVLSSLEENEISFSDISYPISNVPAEVNPADCNDNYKYYRWCNLYKRFSIKRKNSNKCHGAYFPCNSLSKSCRSRSLLDNE